MERTGPITKPRGKTMQNLECPHCGGPLGKGVAICGECGKEVNDQENQDQSPQEERQSGRNIYAVLAVFLVVVGGVALLMFTGVLPNPMKLGSTAAIVNGDKISTEELDQKLELFKKMAGRSGNMESSGPEGKKMLADLRRQVLEAMIQEKVLLTEAVRAKITVSSQEIAERIAAVKKGLNLSDKDFEAFLKNHGMSIANFEKRIEKEFMISKLIAKETQEKGVSKDDLLKELNAKAKVEVLAK
jgi:parvulin-like peptidyl-prolyl isomerase